MGHLHLRLEEGYCDAYRLQEDPTIAPMQLSLKTADSSARVKVQRHPHYLTLAFLPVGDQQMHHLCQTLGSLEDENQPPPDVTPRILNVLAF